MDKKHDTKSFTEQNDKEKEGDDKRRSQLRTLIDVAALNSRVVMEMKPEKAVIGTLRIPYLCLLILVM
jgi:hypothetical protein